MLGVRSVSRSVYIVAIAHRGLAPAEIVARSQEISENESEEDGFSAETESSDEDFVAYPSSSDSVDSEDVDVDETEVQDLRAGK